MNLSELKVAVSFHISAGSFLTYIPGFRAGVSQRSVSFSFDLFETVSFSFGL